MRTNYLKKVDPKTIFRTREALRNWVIDNPEQLEEVFGEELVCVKYKQDDLPILRSDVFSLENRTCKTIAIILNLGKITAEDFVRYFTVAALNDINKMAWIVDDFDNVNHYILEWLNDHSKGCIEFIVLKLSTYELQNKQIATKLERLEKIPVPSLYEDLI